jgi:hypothetical protein
MAAMAVFVGFNLSVYGVPLGPHAFQVVEGFQVTTAFMRGVGFLPTLWGRLLLYAPVAVLVVVGWLIARCERTDPLRRVRRYLAAVVVCSAVAIPFIVPSEGGKEWGPRFMLPCVPPLCLLSAMLLDTLRRRSGEGTRAAGIAVAALAGLFGAGLNCCLGGAILVDDYRHRIAPLLQFVRGADQKVIVVRQKAVAEELEAVWGEKQFFRLGNIDELDRLALGLKDQGVRRFLFLHADYEGRGAPADMDYHGTHVDVPAKLIGQFGYYYYVYSCDIRGPGDVRGGASAGEAHMTASARQPAHSNLIRRGLQVAKQLGQVFFHAGCLSQLHGQRLSSLLNVRDENVEKARDDLVRLGRQRLDLCE